MSNNLVVNLAKPVVDDPECQWALDYVFKALKTKVPNKLPLIQKFKLRFEKTTKIRGAQVLFDRKEIVANQADEAMSLRESEAYLVKQGMILPGQSTSLLPGMIDRPWSTLVKELVHECGHIVDKLSPGPAYKRLDPKLSPTHYGNKAPHEAFAEAFTYYVFGKPIAPEAQRVVEEVLR